MRWLERHSYEDWMNDMATDDSKPAHRRREPMTANTDGVSAMSDELGPDGKLHQDGYFTWRRRDGYMMDAKLPADFVLAEKMRAALAAEREHIAEWLDQDWTADAEEERAHRKFIADKLRQHVA